MTFISPRKNETQTAYMHRCGGTQFSDKEPSACYSALCARETKPDEWTPVFVNMDWAIRNGWRVKGATEKELT